MTKGNNKMKKLILICAVTAVMSGCAAVPANWGAMGGSKADATVKLAYKKGAFQRIKKDDSAPLAIATKKCMAWGYMRAEAFGFETMKCNARLDDSFDSACVSKIFTREYQCS